MATVRFEAAPPAGHVILDRPEAKNALNLDAIRDLLDALARAEAHPGVRAVVIRGTGGDFSAGGDIKDMVARRGKGVETYERLKRGLTAIVRAIVHHERPVLARVDGACLGAGAGIALACDAVLATTSSTFGFPFVRVGLVPDTGTSWLLPHTIGVQNARRLLLTGETIGAKEAAGLGMVTGVVPDAAALDAEVDAWVRRWAALPATAVRDAKRLLWTNLANTLEASIVQESLWQGIRFTSAEHAAAADAFLAKRGGR